MVQWIRGSTNPAYAQISRFKITIVRIWILTAISIVSDTISRDKMWIQGHFCVLHCVFNIFICCMQSFLLIYISVYCEFVGSYVMLLVGKRTYSYLDKFKIKQTFRQFARKTVILKFISTWVVVAKCLAVYVYSWLLV